MNLIKIGTRGSRLALWQANYLKERLAQLNIPSELVVIKTKGDQLQHLSFSKIEGKGFFTKEIEQALLDQTIDVAIHSLKDLPTSSPEGLVISGLSYRENPADWLIIDRSKFEPSKLLKLPENAIVGTSSARRKAQLLNFRPDLQLKDIRGNVPTRLQKLKAEEFDAIMLAAAGILRLEIDLSNFEVLKFNPKEFVPAPAQGVLAYQTRQDQEEVRNIIRQIHQPATAQVTNVERSILKLFDGGCQLPLGAFCEKDSMGNFHVWAVKAQSWDAPLKKVQFSSTTKDDLAETVVAKLKNLGR